MDIRLFLLLCVALFGLVAAQSDGAIFLQKFNESDIAAAEKQTLAEMLSKALEIVRSHRKEGMPKMKETFLKHLINIRFDMKHVKPKNLMRFLFI